MKIKKAIMLVVGLFGGFVGGIVVTLSGLLRIEDVKKAAVNSLSSYIYKLLFGLTPEEEELFRKPRNRKVSYNTYTNLYQMDRERFKKLSFSTRAEAKEILSKMERMIKNFGVVTVADYYKMSNLDDAMSTHYYDNCYGWESLSDVSVIRIGADKFAIDLPLPEHL